MSHPPPPPYGAPSPPGGGHGTGYGGAYGGPPPGAPGGPYGGPHGAPYPPPRRRRKPSAWWFLAPVVALLGGAGLVVVGMVTLLGPLAQEDGVVAADGEAQVLELPDDEPRLLMASERRSSDPVCEATDPASGESLLVRGPGASYSYGDPDGSWTGFAVLDPAGDSVELSCTGGVEGGVRVVAEPGAGAFASFAVMLVVGIGLGLLGFAGLVVVIVLYATGAPRRTTADG